MALERRAGLTLGAATLTTGLLAGLYYAYSCSVMPGLGRTDDHTFVEAMRAINEAILNPAFFLTFVGAPLATAIVAFRERHEGGTARRLVLIALGLHVLAFLSTSAINVPLNDELARTGHRAAFEGAWVAGNILRTVAVTGAFACLVARLRTPSSR